MAKSRNNDNAVALTFIGLFVVGAGIAAWLASGGDEAQNAHSPQNPSSREYQQRENQQIELTSVPASTLPDSSNTSAAPSPATALPAPSSVLAITDPVMLGVDSAQERTLPAPLDAYMYSADNPEGFLRTMRRLIQGEHQPPLEHELSALQFSVAKHTKNLTFSIKVSSRRLYARFSVAAAKTAHVAVEWRTDGQRQRLFITDLNVVGSEAVFAVHQAVGGLPRGEHMLRVYALLDGLPPVAEGVISVQ